jgi:hypothetical protein
MIDHNYKFTDNNYKTFIDRLCFSKTSSIFNRYICDSHTQEYNKEKYAVLEKFIMHTFDNYVPLSSEVTKIIDCINKIPLTTKIFDKLINKNYIFTKIHLNKLINLGLYVNLKDNYDVTIKKINIEYIVDNKYYKIIFKYLDYYDMINLLSDMMIIEIFKSQMCVDCGQYLHLLNMFMEKIKIKNNNILHTVLISFINNETNSINNFLQLEQIFIDDINKMLFVDKITSKLSQCQVIKFINIMKNKKISINIDIINTILKKCDKSIFVPILSIIKQHKIIPNTITLEIISKRFILENNILNIFEQLIDEYKLHPTIVCLNCQISHIFTAKKLNILDIIFEHKIIPDKTSFRKLCQMRIHGMNVKIFDQILEILIINGLIIDEQIIKLSIKYNILIHDYQKYDIILTETEYYLCCVKSCWKYDFYKYSNIEKKVLDLRLMFKNNEKTDIIIKFMKDNIIKPDMYCYFYSYINNSSDMLKLFKKFNCNIPIESFRKEIVGENHVNVYKEYLRLNKKYKMEDKYDEFILQDL